MLWLARFWPAWLTVSAALALDALVLVVAAVRGQWTLKAAGLVLVTGLLVAGPTVVFMHDRTVRGITSVDHDGAIQAEVAMDRLLRGQPIYGVDWTNTAVGQVPWDTSKGPANPALHHNIYSPLVPMIGIPVALAVRALGIGYDYRQVLLAFLFIGLGAVWWLPLVPGRRFAIAAVLFLGPFLGLYVWAGRSDVPVVVLVVLGLALLARDRPVLASLVVGAAVAYKLFAAPAVPFLLATLWLRWRAGRDRWQLARSMLALAVVPAMTILPFALATPAAFVRDVVVYPAAGGPDSYPISGFGMGGALLAVHALQPTDRFPFWIFQLAALAVALRVTLPWFMRHPSAGRWMTGFVASLFAMTFFARYFNDSHAALVLVLLACCVPLGDATLLVDQHPHPDPPPEGEGEAVQLTTRRREQSWLEVGTWR